MIKFLKMTGSRFWSLHCDTVSLLRQKTDFPSGVAILFSIEIWYSKNLQKKGLRSKITSNSFTENKKITSRSPLRVLGKCAGGNLISARSLYPFDDAIDRVIELLPCKTPFSLGSGNQRTEDQKSPFARNSALFFYANFLSVRVCFRPLAQQETIYSQRWGVTAPLNSAKLNQSLASRETRKWPYHEAHCELLAKLEGPCERPLVVYDLIVST